MDIQIQKELLGVASLGLTALSNYIIEHNIDITDDELADIIEMVTIIGSTGKIFRHNDKRRQYLTNQFTPIAFPVIVREDAEFIYDTGTHGITVRNAGWYKIQAQTSIGTTSNSRQTSEHAIFVDGKILDGSTAYGYHRSSKDGNTTVCLQYMVNAHAGAIIDIRAKESTSKDQHTIPMACNIMIERL